MNLPDFIGTVTKQNYFLINFSKLYENLHCAVLAVVRATALRALRALGHMSVGSSEG